MPNTDSDKQQTNFRLSLTARTLLPALAAHYGVSMADVVEMLVRREAKREGIEAKPAKTTARKR